MAGGIIGRFQDATHYYYLRHHAGNNRVELWRIAGTTSAQKTMIAQAPFPTADLPGIFTLNLDMQGTSLVGKLLHDRQVLATVTAEDDAFTSGTAARTRSNTPASATEE